MSDENVLEFDPKLDHFFRNLEKPATEAGAPAEAEPAESKEDAAAFDRLSFFPKPGDPYVSAHARPMTRSLPMVTLLLKDGRRASFSYGDLRLIDVLPPKRPGDGPGLLLRFLGVGQAELEGWNLDRLHGHVFLHRLAWIREWPGGRPVKDDHAVVVTGIMVTLLKE
jgi:hypothetical protein